MTSIFETLSVGVTIPLRIRMGQCMSRDYRRRFPAPKTLDVMGRSTPLQKASSSETTNATFSIFTMAEPGQSNSAKDTVSSRRSGHAVQAPARLKLPHRHGGLGLVLMVAVHRRGRIKAECNLSPVV